MDFSVEDLTQLEYEMPDEEEDDEDEVLQDMLAAAQAQVVDVADESPAAPLNRKMTILLELLAAGPDLDALISQFREDIDLELLQLLQQRLETARNYGQDDHPAVQRLEDMYRTLKLVHQRNEASPSMRLLDEVLDILGEAAAMLGNKNDNPFSPSSSQPEAYSKSVAEAYHERRRDAAARMRSAFTGGAAAGIDIFAAAAALAEAGPLAAEELSVEYVRLHEFLGETTELLEQAKEQQQVRSQMQGVEIKLELNWRPGEPAPVCSLAHHYWHVVVCPAHPTSMLAVQELEENISRAQREVDYAQKRKANQQPAAAKVLGDRVKQLQLARMAFGDRQLSIAQLDDVIFLARSMETEMTIGM